jgi:hypothetical protein
LEEVDEEFSSSPIVNRLDLNADSSLIEAIQAVDFEEPRTTPTKLARLQMTANHDFDIDEPERDHFEEIDEATPFPFSASKAGTAFGLALHRTLEKSNLRDISERGVTEICLPLRVDADEVLLLARAAVSTEPLRRAASSAKVLRETYLGAQRNGEILEGILDLIYQNADGSIEVVDDKTDRVATFADAAVKMKDGYREQGLAYAALVEAALGQRPSHVWFVFVRVNPPAVIDALMQD